MSVFRVPEIHCDGCVRSLTGAVRGVDPAAEVSADLVTKLVTVRTKASDAAVTAAFEDAGFDVEPR
jgi:copper chaperone CopZ